MRLKLDFKLLLIIRKVVVGIRLIHIIKILRRRKNKNTLVNVVRSVILRFIFFHSGIKTTSVKLSFLGISKTSSCLTTYYNGLNMAARRLPDAGIRCSR